MANIEQRKYQLMRSIKKEAKASFFIERWQLSQVSVYYLSC
jgi:hypothetical protein